MDYSERQPSSSPTVRDLKLAKTTLAPILTSWDLKESSGSANFQLELISRLIRPCLHHKIAFEAYGADTSICGKRLVIHRIEFVRGPRQGEVGDYIELPLGPNEVFSIMEQLQQPDKSCQVLTFEPAIAEVIRTPALQDILPEKLKSIPLTSPTKHAPFQNLTSDEDGGQFSSLA